MPSVIDMNHGSGASLEPQTFCDRVNAVIDAALIERRKHEPVRHYLGASQIGEECMRKLYYSYSHTPVDVGRELTARTIRIFDTGHAGEDAAALQMGAEDVPETDVFKATAIKWMGEAGFNLQTRDDHGGQLGFTALDGRFAGHIDGWLIGGPLEDEIPYPNVGWEHKALGSRGWNKIKKHGVKEASPVYYAQMQVYMAYMGMMAYLFTATNKNSQELHHELVMFDAACAQAQSDKAVTVIRAVEAGDLLPRCTDNDEFYLCKWCDWKWRCWNADLK